MLWQCLLTVSHAVLITPALRVTITASIVELNFRRMRSVDMTWFADFTQAEVMSKENRHCLNDSEQPFKHWKKGKRCLSGVFSVAVNAWRASPFAPNAWTISCERQTTLGRVLTTWHEQKSVVTHFVCAGRFWYFLTRQKVHERKTWRKLQVKV